MLTLANAVTFARLCAVPVVLWLVLQREMTAAAVLFALAGASDALDGWLARRWGGSALGAAMDPAADKALLVGIVVMLAWLGVLPVWLAVVIVGRDVLVVGGVLILWARGVAVRIRPSRLSKLNTALQLGLVGVVLVLEAAGLGWPWLRAGLMGIVAVTTLASGAAYVGEALRTRWT